MPSSLQVCPKVGLTPDYGMLHTLSERVVHGYARRIMMYATPLDGQSENTKEGRLAFREMGGPSSKTNRKSRTLRGLPVRLR